MWILKTDPRAEGVDKIYHPGELEFISERRAQTEGIELSAESAAELDRAEKLGQRKKGRSDAVFLCCPA